MLKKTMTFKDLDGNDVTEDFYFNLSKAELAEMEIASEGGMVAHLQRLIEKNNGQEIIDTFKAIIAKAVGQRSEDGRRFIKSQEIIDDFFQTEAYSNLFLELVTDADKSAEFINGIVPSDLAEVVNEEGRITNLELPDEPWVKEDRDPTPEELQRMSPEQLKAAFVRKTNAIEQKTD